MPINVAFVDDTELMRHEFKIAVDELNRLGFSINVEIFETRDQALERINDSNAVKPDVFFVDYNIWEKPEGCQIPIDTKGTPVVEAANDADIVTIGFSGKTRKDWDPSLSILKTPGTMLLTISLALQKAQALEIISPNARNAIPVFTEEIYTAIGDEISKRTYILRAEGGALSDPEALKVLVGAINSDEMPKIGPDGKQETRQTVEANPHFFLEIDKVIDKLGIPEKEIKHFYPENADTDLASIVSHIAKCHPNSLIKEGTGLKIGAVKSVIQQGRDLEKEIG